MEDWAALFFLKYFHKFFQHLWVEVFAALGAEVFQRVLLRPGGAVGAVTGERVPHIRDGENSGGDGDFLAF